MKTKLSITLATAALFLIPAAHPFAQMSGTSHPEDLDDTVPTVPVDNTHYVPPAHDTQSTSPVVQTSATTESDSEPSDPVLYRHSAPMASSPVQTATLTNIDPTLAVTSDVNSGIVTNVPVGPNELPIGTLLKAKLQSPVSTESTAEGARFTAVVTNDVNHDGVTLIASGSRIYGRVTRIHGGRRIGGPSVIRLQPDSISLPDGSTYKLNAEVNDLDDFQPSHVNNEGTIVGSSHRAETVGALSITTTGATVAGAMMGGPVGAVAGLAVGAGVSTVLWLKQDREQQLPSGTQIVFALNDSLQMNTKTR